MTGLLTPISQTYRNAASEDQFLSVSKPDVPASRLNQTFSGASPEEALETLRNQPGYEELIAVLNYLREQPEKQQTWDIRTPGPQSAQIIHVLVTEIVPNYWTVLQESSSSRGGGEVELLLACLRNITGVNAVLAYMRALVREARSEERHLKKLPYALNLSSCLAVLTRLLHGNHAARNIWKTVENLNSPSQIRSLRQEFISLLAGGKLISHTAEADDLCQKDGKVNQEPWIADGKHYVDWLGRNIVEWASSGVCEEQLKLCADLAARGMRLGHSDKLIKVLFTGLLFRRGGTQDIFSEILNELPHLEQRKVLFTVLQSLSNEFFPSVTQSTNKDDSAVISAAAGAIKTIVQSAEAQKNNLLDWLTNSSGAGIGEGCGIRRAVLAALADDKDTMSMVLEKSIRQFGDQLYMKHTPMLQQDAHAQILLLSAGYTHRTAPIKLTLLLRSSAYLNGISNRIASSQVRARFLGMVIGEALSGLVHQKDTKLDFKMDETDTEEAKWYKSLVFISDKVGPLDPLKVSISTSGTQTTFSPTKPASRPAAIPGRIPQKSGFVIEEVEDDCEDPDLTPYAKPNSDAEDSDDDPALVNRDKPKAPVYIRDLINFLRDTENYDRQKIALTTAPTLIRRKASYGSEVSSHAEEMATLLVGLPNKYELEGFDDLRLQGMVAIVVAQPKTMGQWFAKTFFDGDYSLSQRASILIALGLGGREVAGFETSEYAAAAQFASKTLPPKVEKHYIQSTKNTHSSSASNLKALPPNALDHLAQSLSQTLLAPLAAEAADAVTGPDALKLSSFTSRLQHSGTSKSRNSKPKGIRVIPNTIAALISSSFFFPLTSRFQAAVHSASAAARGILFQPYLLTLYLKTLALLLHAAGPSTISLQQMTTEFWDLLLGVRNQCVGELGITQSVLFGLMALLDVNEGDMRGLCERQGRELVETMEWVSNVFNTTRGGDASRASEENEVKMLAASVLIRLRETVEKYQALLMSDMIGAT
ncbi:telomere length regulation protein-domain-containing protein [Xylariaceae sp. FL0016]|nr:telomere length regulation protein-domain-containing protein [Xylariaceae sp. FL0016]